MVNDKPVIKNRRKKQSVANKEESTTRHDDNPGSLEQIATYVDKIQSSVIPTFQWDVFFNQDINIQPWKDRNQYIIIPMQKHCTNTKLKIVL